MKYIPADKLIAEIKRQIEETKSMKPSFDQFWAGQISAFKGAIKIAESLQQEQPEVDLAEEITRFFSKNPIPHEHITDWPLLKNTAIHFYGLRNRALEEAARHVYESWNGGTMDDVRRDMAELGKVLNARKEE